MKALSRVRIVARTPGPIFSLGERVGASGSSVGWLNRAEVERIRVTTMRKRADNGRDNWDILFYLCDQPGRGPIGNQDGCAPFGNCTRKQGQVAELILPNPSPYVIMPQEVYPLWLDK
jgi:hypothetical protein